MSAKQDQNPAPVSIETPKCPGCGRGDLVSRIKVWNGWLWHCNQCARDWYANPEQAAFVAGALAQAQRTFNHFRGRTEYLRQNHQGNRRFFSVHGGDSYSQLALLHVKNRVGSVALRVGRFILLEVETLLAQPSSREKGLGIENRIAIFRLRLGRLTPGRGRNFACRWFCGGFADRTELADGIRLAGRPWLRVGMASALISYLRRSGAAFTLRHYTSQKPAVCSLRSILNRLLRPGPVSLLKDLGFEKKIPAQEEQSWTHLPVSTSVNSAASRSTLKLNCASTKRLVKAAQDRRAANIMASCTRRSGAAPMKWLTLLAAC